MVGLMSFKNRRLDLDRKIWQFAHLWGKWTSRNPTIYDTWDRFSDLQKISDLRKFLTSRHVRMHEVIFYMTNTLKKLTISA